MSKFAVSPIFLHGFFWIFANFLLCSAPNPMNNFALGKASPLFGELPKFHFQNKSEEQKILLKKVPIRRIASANSPIEIASKNPIKFVEKKNLLKPQVKLVQEKNGQNSNILPIGPIFKCSLNKFLSAVVTAHGVYHKVPTKTIAKIALNLIFAVLSSQNWSIMQQNSDQPIFDGILTFDHFSADCVNGFEFSDEQLAGNLRFELNKTLQMIKDPRERSLLRDQRTKQPIIWLKDLLFMSPEQIKEQRATTLDKDLVWFVGLLLYRMLFNRKHPMDNWEAKRRLDMQFMAKMSDLKQFHAMQKRDDFVPGDFGIVPLNPKDRWVWMPESGRDETGEMALVEAWIGIEQEYIFQLRNIVAELMENNNKMKFNFSRFAADEENEQLKKLFGLNKLCLETFPELRIELSSLVQILSLMSN